MYDPYLSELMRKYKFSIVEMRGLHGGSSPWEKGTATRFSASGRWREVAIRIRRDIHCECCGHPFSIAFPLVMDSIVDKGVSTLDSARLLAALERHLQSHIRCPRCGASQQKTRQQARQRNTRHSLIGLSTIGGNLLGAAILSLAGYALAGKLGLAVGLGLSIVLLIRLTRWMLNQLLDSDL